MTYFTVHGGQLLCRSFLPASDYRELYAALVCGVNVADGLTKRLFVDTGLIHILVVSGAHLGVIERPCRRLPRALRLGILTLYCWLTDFGAPVVRALMTRALAPCLRGRGASVMQIEFVASVALLMMIPAWMTSRSFIMSWLCAVALKCPGPRGPWPALTDGVRVYVLLYPFSLAAPLTIAWNCLVAPAIGNIMFPVSTLAMVAPPLAPLADAVWRGLLWALTAGPRVAAEGLMIEIGWIWWLPWVTHLLILYGEHQWRRARAFV